MQKKIEDAKVSTKVSLRLQQVFSLLLLTGRLSREQTKNWVLVGSTEKILRPLPPL